jgi:hypothetical protein
VMGQVGHADSNPERKGPKRALVPLWIR